MNNFSQLGTLSDTLSDILKQFMTKSAFSAKYRIHFYRVTEAIEQGKIAVHCVNGANYINVEEALSVLRPKKLEKAVARTDLFS